MVWIMMVIKEILLLQQLLLEKALATMVTRE
jgi:hypothetical protein